MNRPNQPDIPTASQPGVPAPPLAVGESGEMARRVREFDWSKTPLGPTDAWPQALKIAVGICLSSRFPMFVWWGKHLINIYNDAYIPMLGARHPRALGRPARDSWDDIWDVVGKQADLVMQLGQATWNDRVPLLMHRHGYPEQTWFTWSYSPIPDGNGGTGGLFCAVTEETDRVLAERRTRTVLESITDAFFAVDRDWRFTYANPQAQRILDRTVPDDLVGKVLWDEYPGLIGSEFETAYRRTAADRIPSSVTAFYPDHDRFYEIHAYPADDGGISVYFRNVTQRKRDEETLRKLASDFERHSRTFEQIASTTPDFIYVFDLNYRFTYANRRLLEVWGRSFDDAIGKSLPELGYPRWHVEMHHRELDQVVRTKMPIKGEVPFTGGSGISGVYEYIFTPVLGPDGNVEAIAGTTRDVTDRNRIEKDLADAKAAAELALVAQQRSQALFRAAFDQSMVGIVLCDTDGRVEQANPAFCHLVGRPLDALVGQTSVDYSHPDDVARNVDVIGRAAARTSPSTAYEKRYVRPDGSVVHVQIHLSPVRDADGQPVRLIAVVEDITDRKRADAERQHLLDAERAARAEAETLVDVGRTLTGELELHSLVQNVTDATTSLTRAAFGAFFYNVLDDKGESYSLYTLSGVPREKFANFPMPRSTGIFAPTFKGEPGALRLHDVTQDPRYGKNAPYKGQPPGHLPVRSYLAVPVVSRSGEVLGGLFFGHPEPGVFTDRDERIVLAVAAQTSVAMDNVRLFDDARRANAAKDALLSSERAARADAERASRMKDEFLATLSHELRTPLNAIVGWSQILRSSSASPADLTEGLATIERNARAQAQIIEDLLDMSRIISGKVRLDVRRVDLADVLKAAADTVRPAADARGVRLHLVIDPCAGPVMGDENRLQQVFWNLLANAVKFTPRAGRVHVTCRRAGSHVEVTVADTGEGIPADFLPHVFDRFRQADASTTRRHGGLGLGLAIVKQLVELHGGNVRVASPGRGKGATFTVALPVSPIHAADPRSAEIAGTQRVPGPSPTSLAQATDLPDLTGLSIVVVDDEPDARTLVKRLLEDRGASVRTAPSAADALSLIRPAPPDILVSDIGMPDTDGYALVKQLRGLPPDQGGQIPAVALTAYARAEDRMKALAAGFQMHVVKPVEPAELLVVVASLTGRVKP